MQNARTCMVYSEGETLRTEMKVERVFISHAREDAGFARYLRAEIKRAGLIPVDDSDFHVGHDFPPEIEARIAEAAHFCVIVSSSSIRSRWVAREIILAFEQSPPRLSIIPILIDWSEFSEFGLYPADKDAQLCAFDLYVEKLSKRNGVPARYGDVFLPRLIRSLQNPDQAIEGGNSGDHPSASGPDEVLLILAHTEVWRDLPFGATLPVLVDASDPQQTLTISGALTYCAFHGFAEQFCPTSENASLHLGAGVTSTDLWRLSAKGKRHIRHQAPSWLVPKFWNFIFTFLSLALVALWMLAQMAQDSFATGRDLPWTKAAGITGVTLTLAITFSAVDLAEFWFRRWKPVQWLYRRMLAGQPVVQPLIVFLESVPYLLLAGLVHISAPSLAHEFASRPIWYLIWYGAALAAGYARLKHMIWQCLGGVPPREPLVILVIMVLAMLIPHLFPSGTISISQLYHVYFLAFIALTIVRGGLASRVWRLVKRSTNRRSTS